MALTSIGAVAGHFGRDVQRTLAKLTALVESARQGGTDLLVLPGATVGGYVPDLVHPGLDDLPPTFTLDSPVIAQVRKLAGGMTICFGFCELDDGLRYNAAVCVSGDGVLGHHRHLDACAGLQRL